MQKTDTELSASPFPLPNSKKQCEAQNKELKHVYLIHCTCHFTMVTGRTALMRNLAVI